MVIAFTVVLLAWTVYSYSQIDLNLTLLQNSWFLAFQHDMIQLGYFQRPLSTAIFVFLLILSFLFYLLFIRRAGRLNKKSVLILLGALAILGLISYPAFSHDFFNYIFDARILVYHHANPYASTALMFPGDTWIRFMQWTHRTYPYGPLFLPLSALFYLPGLGKFILTFFWFKGLMVAAYLGSAYLIARLSGTKGLLLFALNPLVIIEAVISSHLDIVMLFFSLLAFYLLVRGIKFWSYLNLLISIGIKYATVTFLPVWLFWTRFTEKQRIYYLIALAYLGVLAQIASREILPHYFLVPIGFSALLPQSRRLWAATIILSLALLLARYLPFLYSGQWLTLKF